MPRPINIIVYVLIIALSAQLTIDLNLPNVTIPVSGQTLAILAGAVFLKPLEALIGILIYCIVGILGMPVFSDGGSGWKAFSGPSLGYFIGFVIAAVFMSYMASIKKTETIGQLICMMTIGTLIILFLGTAYLALEHGLAKGIEYGFTPFVLGGLVKIILGAILVLGIKWLRAKSINVKT